MQVSWNGSSSFVNNCFTGTIMGSAIVGTTKNGDSPVLGTAGCSNPWGPSGTFTLTRTP